MRVKSIAFHNALVKIAAGLKVPPVVKAPQPVEPPQQPPPLPQRVGVMTRAEAMGLRIDRFVMDNPDATVHDLVMFEARLEAEFTKREIEANQPSKRVLNKFRQIRADNVALVSRVERQAAGEKLPRPSQSALREARRWRREQRRQLASPARRHRLQKGQSGLLPLP